ncbi:MAG: HAMP domain-containing histidine kinase [Clostridia bacterium]|nr:HAMP domain-containing histidine kinase [Clostridia bacterium]
MKPTQKSRSPKDRFSLRARMVFLVQVELLLVAGLTYLIDLLARSLNPDWSVSVILELIIVSLIVGAVLTYFASRMFFDPIRRLRRAMERVSQADFTASLEAKKGATEEIRELYAGFNLMVRELRATEVLQKDFVSNVSHEFKTPINAIEGYATLLQGGEHLTDREREEYVDKILFNTRRLSALVGNILLLSRIENRAIFPKKSVYRLDEQIRQSILLLEGEWSKKEVELDVEMEDLSFCGMENLMGHVWLNLIGNAIKFGPVGGTVSIRLKREGERVVFSVEDEGPGIPEESIKHIFDQFYQADTSHRSEGNGLGLSLAKRIVSLSEGELLAENRECGGCRFTVILNT